jgi:hypothetical protein
VASGNERLPDAVGRTLVTLDETVECDGGVAAPMTADLERHKQNVAHFGRPAGPKERG